MKWALKDNERILATKKSKAKCPICNGGVISKCGSIKVWHWSHKANKDCDDWYEPESEWHLNWKNEFPKEQQEFTMGKHRADIRTKDRWIIELQNSSISSEKIIEREKYYRRMIWLLNSKTLTKGLYIGKKEKLIYFCWEHPPKSWWFAKKEVYIDLDESIKILKEDLKLYENGKKIHLMPIYEEYEFYNEHIDDYMIGKKIIGDEDNTKGYIEFLKEKIKLLDNKIFLIKRIEHKCPCNGWGILISKEDFLKKFKGGENG